MSLDSGQTGVLTIFCIIGDPPPSVGEGIHLILGGGVSSNYTDEGHGFTIFIAI
jgi:hypothetical protein